MCILCNKSQFKSFKEYSRHMTQIHSLQALESQFRPVGRDSGIDLRPINHSGRTKAQIVADVEAYFNYHWKNAGIDSPIIGA